MHHRPRFGSSATGLLLALVALVTLAPLSHAGSFPQTRQGWLVGFSVGGGSAEVSTNGSRGTDKESGGAGTFRVGYALNSNFSLEYNSNGWAKSKDGVTIAYLNNTAALNYYPRHNAFVLRGGVGICSALGSETLLNNSTVADHESGPAFSLGAAYEFRVTRTFAIGPQFDYGWTTLTVGATWMSVGLGFNWYFIPR